MSTTQPLLDLTLAMLRLVLYASLPTVLTAALIGLLVGLVQAVTQLQDQALPFALKFVAVALALALTLPWLSKSMDIFMRQAFESITRIA
jgi:type III secretion protein S